MNSFTQTIGHFRVTIWGNGTAVEIARENLAGDVIDSVFLQGDEAAEVCRDLDGWEDGNEWMVDAYLAEYV